MKAMINGKEHYVQRSRHLRGVLVDIQLHEKGIQDQRDKYMKTIKVFDVGRLREVLSEEEVEQCYDSELHVPYRICGRDNS